MSNEKILTITAGNSLLVTERAAWEAAGWTIKFDAGCVPVEDRSGSMSSETVKAMMAELNKLFQNMDEKVTDFQFIPMDMSSSMSDNYAFPTPESFKKAGDIMLALDFTDSISKTDMDSFLKEIDELDELGHVIVITDGDK